MARNNDRRKQPLRLRLIEEMKTGIFSHSARLPRESELAEMLGISRTQLRDILSRLDREGYISRVHGVGTLINRHTLNVNTRIDIELEFNEYVRSQGLEPGLRILDYQVRPGDERMTAALELPPLSPVLSVTRLITADGHNAILCENNLDAAQIKTPAYGPEDFQPTIFDFLERCCELYTFMDIVDMQAVAADTRQAQLLELTPGQPLMFMDETDYDVNGCPVLHSRHWYGSGLLRHTLVRKKL